MDIESWFKKNVRCPLDMTFAVIGGKYKVKIIYFLIGQTLRFSEIQRCIDDATPKMLSRQLHELENDGIIHRELYPVVPPKTEYSLTERGRSLIPLIVMMYQWGEKLFNEYGIQNTCKTEDYERMYREASLYSKADIVEPLSYK